MITLAVLPWMAQAQPAMVDRAIGEGEIAAAMGEGLDAHQLVARLRPAWLAADEILVRVEDGPIWTGAHKLASLAVGTLRSVHCEWRDDGRTVLLTAAVQSYWTRPRALDPFVGEFHHAYFDVAMDRAASGYVGWIVAREWRAEVRAHRDDNDDLAGHFMLWGDRYDFAAEAGDRASRLTLWLPIAAARVDRRRSFGRWRKVRYRVTRVR